MHKPDYSWLFAFAPVRHLFGPGDADAGMDARGLRRYADLNPMEAALAYGNDYDWDRRSSLAPYTAHEHEHRPM